MKNTNTGISRFFVPALMVGVMAVTLPATVAFAQRVFPGNLIRQITLVGLTEAAFIAWHAATLFAARGDKQHSVAHAMTWVSLFGAAAMAAAEIAFEYSDASLMARPEWLAPVSLLVLTLLIVAHLSAGVMFANWAPQNVKRRSEDRAQAAIDEAVAEQLEQQAPKIAAHVAQQRVAAQLDLIRAQHSVAASADDNATRVLRKALPELPPVVMAKDGDAAADGAEVPSSGAAQKGTPQN
jgi:hypothetical protein